MVIIDPNSGDVLALASWPTYDPNVFVPSISADQLKALQSDPDIPLLPRAYRSSYPPGSTFKVAVGIAALESHAIYPADQYECTPAIQIGNVTFHNWKKSNRGALNFVQALTESCDTWFYQVGIKTGSGPIIDWALKLGFGAKCGIPLRGEAEGRIPNDEYMKATHGRKILNGDIANISIGQGDVQVTPLQMAQAMGIVANGGTFYQTRLVQQVQTFDNQIVTAYQVRAKRTLDLSQETLEQVRTGMIDVVNGGGGTAHQASLENVTVAGKTGTAQWGPKHKERTAAWFAGFLPADQPRYAFAAVYEGDVGSKVHGGSAAAPMIADVLKDVYKGQMLSSRWSAALANNPKSAAPNRSRKTTNPINSGERTRPSAGDGGSPSRTFFSNLRLEVHCGGTPQPAREGACAPQIIPPPQFRGSSMVPLNFGGSSSTPKFPEYSSPIFAMSSEVSGAVSGAFANSTQLFLVINVWECGSHALVRQQPLQGCLSKRALRIFEKSQLLDFFDPVQQPAPRSMAAMISWRKFRLSCVLAFQHSRRMRHTNEKHRVLAGVSRGTMKSAPGMLLEHVVDVLDTRDVALPNAIQSFIQPADRGPERNSVTPNFSFDF